MSPSISLVDSRPNSISSTSMSTTPIAVRVASMLRDVRRFALFLVGLHDQLLNERWIDETADDEHDEPQPDRDDRVSPTVGADGRQEQHRGEQGDQHEQHQGR